MSGTITHKWSGTVLTITSDSGTSSADLKGATGDKGCRGPQGRCGVILDADGNIDMTGYATETYVNEKISDVQAPDLSDYYTKEETVALIDNVNVDLTGYATEEYVDNAVENVDLTGYATENFVTTKIAAAQLEGAGIDMSGYATTEYVDNAVAGASGGVGQAGSGLYAEIFNDYTNNKAKGKYSHAEGNGTTAGTLTQGYASHAEGYKTEAVAHYSHAEGNNTRVIGNSSHTEGIGTIAEYASQHVEGTYNAIDDSAHKLKYSADTTVASKGKYVHIVGNGTSDDDRSNCHTLDWDGNAWFKGKVYVGGTSMDDATELGTGGSSVDLSNYYTKTEVDNKIPDVSGYALKTEIPTVPSNVSAFTNDAGYLTEHQSLTDYATKTYVDNAVANVSGGGDIDLSAYATKEYVTGLGYQTEAQVLALIQANMPASGDEVSY